MSEKHHIIPVWFFVGFLLLVYGVLIFISGLVDWSNKTHVVLGNLHASVWWGALLTVLGAVYCIIFRPGKQTRQ